MPKRNQKLLVDKIQLGGVYVAWSLCVTMDWYLKIILETQGYRERWLFTFNFISHEMENHGTHTRR
jgi:hypothetical protein